MPENAEHRCSVLRGLSVHYHAAIGLMGAGWWAGGTVYVLGWIGFAFIDGNNPSRATVLLTLIGTVTALLLVKGTVDWLHNRRVLNLDSKHSEV